MSSARSTEPEAEPEPELTAEEARKARVRGLRIVRGIRLAIGLGGFVLVIMTGSLAGALNAELVIGGIAIGALIWFVYRMFAVLLAPATPGSEMAPASGWRRRELEREKYWLLKAIKELEFDFEMRKVSEGDFREISAGYRVRAIRVMRELDAKEPDYKSVIDKEVQDRVARMGSSATAPAPAPAAASAPAASAPAAKAEPENRGQGTGNGDVKLSGTPADAPAVAVAGEVGALSVACPKCATRNDADAEFCKKCGAALAVDKPVTA